MWKILSSSGILFLNMLLTHAMLLTHVKYTHIKSLHKTIKAFLASIENIYWNQEKEII